MVIKDKISLINPSYRKYLGGEGSLDNTEVKFKVQFIATKDKGRYDKTG